MYAIADQAPSPDVAASTSGIPLVVVMGGLLFAGLGLAAVAREFRNLRERRAERG